MSHDITHVEVAFPLRGAVIPVDHGYALFAALSGCLPRLHERPEWIIAPVSGRYTGRGGLRLTARSRLRVRLPGSEIARLLGLAGRRIRIRGSDCVVGHPRVFALRPCERLRARLVLIKGAAGPAGDLVAAVRRQLAALPGVGEAGESIEIRPGDRRVMRIKGVAIPGHAVTLEGVPASASIEIQARGLGGRRHMGAGVFVPLRRERGGTGERAGGPIIASVGGVHRVV